MGRSIAIKSAITLTVIVLVYSIYWFFRVGQVEKRINNFISENASSVAAQVSVSGFPFSQKITISDLKFTLPSPALNKRQVMVKNIVAKASIFSSDFVVTEFAEVTTQDDVGNLSQVEFNKNPDIAFSIADSRMAKFTYKDFGYRVLDKDKNTIYASGNATVNLDSSVDDAGKIIMRILVNIKDIEGYDVMDLYKNAFAQKIIDGLKTGEIALGNTNTALIPSQLDEPAIQSLSSEASDIIKKSQELVKQASSKLAKDEVAPVVAPTPTLPAVVANAPTANPVVAVPSVAVVENAPAPIDNAAATDQQNKELEAVVANNNLVKSNFMMNVEYSLVPLQNQAQAQFDPTQIQENSAIHYSKSINIANVEFSNPVYKISFNGEINIFQDDNLPSGMISVRIEKFDNLINYIVTSFNKIIESSATETATADNNSYQNFLKRVVLGMDVISKELAAKNAVSKDDIAAFDVRREKNLEFLINETATREILGKF